MWLAWKEGWSHGNELCRALLAIAPLAFYLGERGGHWIVLSLRRTKYAYQDLCGFCVEKSLTGDKGASKETLQ